MVRLEIPDREARRLLRVLDSQGRTERFPNRRMVQVDVVDFQRWAVEGSAHPVSRKQRVAESRTMVDLCFSSKPEQRPRIGQSFRREIEGVEHSPNR
jgi:hypothetical protein